MSVVKLQRTVVFLASVVAVLAATTSAAHAFAGRDGMLVYSWYSLTDTELEPHLTTQELGIKAVAAGGGTPVTLRGCAQATGQPDVGDCSIGYGAPAVSPDGTRVAFATGTSLALMKIDGSGFRLLPAHSADDSQPAFSPTGRSLAFSAGPIPSVHHPLARGLRISDLAGAHVRRVTARGISPAWSSHDWIAFLRVDGVYRVRPDGHGLRRLVARHKCTDVAWSPHGTKLAFTCGERLLVSNGDGSHMRRVPGTGSAQDVAWSPSGKWLAVSIFDGGVATMGTDGSPGPGGVGGGVGALYQFGAGGVDWQPLR